MGLRSGGFFCTQSILLYQHSYRELGNPKNPNSTPEHPKAEEVAKEEDRTHALDECFSRRTWGALVSSCSSNSLINERCNFRDASYHHPSRSELRYYMYSEDLDCPKP